MGEHSDTNKFHANGPICFWNEPRRGTSLRTGNQPEYRLQGAAGDSPRILQRDSRSEGQPEIPDGSSTLLLAPQEWDVSMPFI